MVMMMVVMIMVKMMVMVYSGDGDDNGNGGGGNDNVVDDDDSHCDDNGGDENGGESCGFDESCKTSPSFSVVYITVPNSQVADKLSSDLVTAGYAACCNIVPNIKSVYKWEGKIESESELLLIVKTRAGSLAEEMIQFVRDNHPYDTPEIIQVGGVLNGNEEYLNWIADNTNEGEKK